MAEQKDTTNDPENMQSEASRATGKEKVSENERIKLGDVVVTATKTEKVLEDVPGSVSVITQEQMQKQDVKTLDEALQYVPGVFARPKKGLMDSGPSVRMRGFNGNKYTLVLVDGQPINEPYYGEVAFAAMPVDNVERIEVIRGPASALYGGNAMGGVINIITKTPEKLEASLTGGYGTDNTRRIRFSIGDRLWDRLSLQLGLEKETTDGYIATPIVHSISEGDGNTTGGYATKNSTGDDKWVVGDAGENGAEREGINGKVTYDFSSTGELSLNAFYGRSAYDYGEPHTYMGTFGDSTTYADAQPSYRARFQPNDFINYTGIGEVENQGYGVGITELFGPVEIHANATCQFYDKQYTLETGSGDDNYSNSPGMLSIIEADKWFGDLQASTPLFESHLLTIGGSYRYDDATNNYYDIPFYRSYDGPKDYYFTAGGNAKTWSLFVQDEWQILEPLTFYLGLRYDNWTVSDGFSGEPGDETKYPSATEDCYSPKVAAVWKILSDTTFRATAGHAFRPPTLQELYHSSTSGGTTYHSNPNLEPETLWSYEVRIDQSFFDRKTNLSLTGYRNDIEDLIKYDSDGDDKNRINIGEAQTYGVEFEISQKVTDWLNLWGNYSYTDARVISDPDHPENEDKQVTGIPKHTYSIGSDVVYKNFKVWLAGRYFSKVYSNSDNTDTEEGVYGSYEPAFLLDGKITYSPIKYMDVSLSVDNILDSEYYQYYAMPGRTFMAELTLKY